MKTKYYGLFLGIFRDLHFIMTPVFIMGLVRMLFIVSDRNLALTTYPTSGELDH